MLNKELEKLGLNSRESRVYLALLQLGEATMQQIAAKSGVKRTTVYGIIKSLKEQGLLRIVIGQKKILYSAQNPKKIEEGLKEKQNVLEKIMPQLLVLSSATHPKTFVSYFENEKGIKDIHKDILSQADQELFLWAAKGIGTELLQDALLQNKTSWKTIVSRKEANKLLAGFSLKNFSTIRVIEENQLLIEAEIVLYGGNKVAVMPVAENIGIVIENEKVFDTLKGVFLFVWEALNR